jgi:hypothetical protein
MKIRQEIYLKEEGFSPEKCIAELESPVSSKFVSVRINGKRHDYYNLLKTSLTEIVDITLLRTPSEKVLEEIKSIITRLEKETLTKNEKMIKETTTNQDLDKLAEMQKENREIMGNLKQATETPMFGDNDKFAQAITEAGIKAAKATHEFNMKEIKAKLISDLCKELVKMNIYHTDVPQIAREIADKALENL